jgi:hypothetical protein
MLRIDPLPQLALGRKPSAPFAALAAIAPPQ